MPHGFYGENGTDVPYTEAGASGQHNLEHAHTTAQDIFNRQFERMHDCMQPSGGIEDARQYEVAHHSSLGNDDGDDNMAQSPPSRQPVLHSGRDYFMDDMPRTSSMDYASAVSSDFGQVTVLHAFLYVPTRVCTYFHWRHKKLCRIHTYIKE
jgi:hypothetical protein